MTNKIETPDPRQHPDATRPGTDYYEKIYDRTLLEWKKFINGGGPVDPSVVPQVILQSWIRSREMGIDPLKKPKHHILTDDDLERLLEKNKHFIEVSRLIISNLFEVVRTPTPPAASIYDQSGFLLDIVVEDKFKQALDRI